MPELYVGNLLYEVTTDEVRALLEPFGAIEAIELLTKSGPGRPHAYAFVQIERQAAEAAIRAFRRLDRPGLVGR